MTTNLYTPPRRDDLDVSYFAYNFKRSHEFSAYINCVCFLYYKLTALIPTRQ